MRILVTGAMGFIGSNLVPRLLNAGHVVIGFDNLSHHSVDAIERIKEQAGDNWANFILHPGDICKTEALQLSLGPHEIDAVVHLAAQGSVPRSFSEPAECVRANEYGFANLAHEMKRAGIKRLVFASSSSVYGDSVKNVKIEGEEGRALSPYAMSKKQNEEFARIYCKAVNIAYVGLRFFNVYGPGQRFESDFSAVIPKFIHTTTPTINGDGSTRRDFTFVGDVARAIELSLKFTETNKDAAEVLNVGTGQGVTLKALVSMLGKDATFGPARAGDIAISVASTTKAEQVIGFKAETSLPIGLEITKAFYERVRA